MDRYCSVRNILHFRLITVHSPFNNYGENQGVQINKLRQGDVLNIDLNTLYVINYIIGHKGIRVYGYIYFHVNVYKNY